MSQQPFGTQEKGSKASAVMQPSYIRRSPLPSPRALYPISDLDATLAPFRRIALNHMPPTGRQFVAPTVVDPEEWTKQEESVSKEAWTEVPPQQEAKPEAISVTLDVNEAGSPSIVLNINAHTVNVNVYKLTPCHPDCVGLVSTVHAAGSTELSGKAEELVKLVNKTAAELQPSQMTSAHGDGGKQAKDQPFISPASPNVFPVPVGNDDLMRLPDWRDITVPAGGSPDLLSSDHLQTLRESGSHHGGDIDGDQQALAPKVSGTATEGGSDAFDDDFRLD